MKKPWLAVLLNILPFPLGLGYLYLRLYRRFAMAFPGGSAAAGLGVVVFSICLCSDTGDYMVALFVSLVLPAVIAVLSAMDAWRIMRRGT